MTDTPNRSYYFSIHIETTEADARLWYTDVLRFVGNQIAQCNTTPAALSVSFNEVTDDDDDDDELRRIQRMRGGQ